MDDRSANNELPLFVAIATPYAVLNSGIAMELRSYPDLHVVASTTIPRLAVQVAEAVQPEVIIIDEHLSLMSGVDLIATVHEVAPTARILAILAGDFRTAMLRAYRAGATGFVTASATLSSLLRGVGALATGMPWLDPCIFTELSGEQEAGTGDFLPSVDERDALLERPLEAAEDRTAAFRYQPAVRHRTANRWAVGGQ